MRLILASNSPRRKAILALLGISFDTISPGVAEKSDPLWSASEEVSHWATQKARVVSSTHPDAIVIGGDTLIDFNGRKVGKPRSHTEAFRILQMLVGHEHWVLTATCIVLAGGEEQTAIEKVRISMRSPPEKVFAEYAASDEPLDKAGAYSVQGKGHVLIESITGDYLAAVGLPLRSVAKTLHEAGIFLPVDVDMVYKERSFLNWRTFEK